MDSRGDAGIEVVFALGAVGVSEAKTRRQARSEAKAVAPKDPTA